MWTQEKRDLLYKNMGVSQPTAPAWQDEWKKAAGIKTDSEMVKQIETEKPVEPPKSIFEKFAGTLAKPFTKTIASAMNVGETVYDLARGDYEGASEATRKERDFGLLGKSRSVGQDQETGKDLSVGGSIKDVLGTGVEIGSWLAPASAGAKIIKGVAPSIKGLAIGGAISGGMSAGGTALQEQKGIGDTLLSTAGGAALGAVAGPILGKTLEKATKGVKSLFTKPLASAEEVITHADDALKNLPKNAKASEIRSLAEQSAPKVSLREKWGGVRPDIKKRIAGKAEKLQEYFDVSHARNLDDTVPTPLDYAAQKLDGVRDKINGVLNDVGSTLGKFRTKISTYQAPRGSIEGLMDSFRTNLKGLNLDIVDNSISRLKGKVAGKVSDSEMKLLQSLYDDILTVSDAPSLENMIDLRNAFDNRVNFAKQAKEASNIVDPISRKMRSEIARINEMMVGKSEAKNISTYSDIRGLADELNNIADSKSGAEFLLKRVLSERGRLPRELFNAVKNITGVDLMDDATMAQLATELIGNPAQQGLLRQEISKASLDAMDIMDLVSGAPGAGFRAVKTLMQKGKEKIADPEKMFLKAASKPKIPKLPKGKAVASAEQKGLQSMMGGVANIKK